MPGGSTAEIAGAAAALADAMVAVPVASAEAATPNNAGSTSMATGSSRCDIT
jgi:hypothetical protein